MKRRIIGAIGAAVVSALLLSGCAGSATADKPTHDDTLRLATMTVPLSLDPKDAIGGALPFFQAVYDTLVLRTPDGKFSPMLATEWSYNADQTVLSMTLRTGVKFDDGTPFNAAAATANLERFRDSGGPDAAHLAGVTIAAVDDSHITLTLSQPDPGLLFFLSDSAGLMANPADFDKKDALTTSPDGTGPYVLDKEKTAIGTKWVYERRADYWGDKPDFATVVMQVFDNENAVVNGLKTGQIDSALLQTADQQLSAEQDKSLSFQDVLFDFQGVLLFDRGGAVTPALAKPEVRQALNYAVDRKTMLKVVRDGRGEVTDQVWGKDSQGYEKSLDDHYSYDPTKAKQLLAEAGYPDGFALTLPRMTSIVTDNIASALQTDFAAVGVKLTWADVDAASALKQIFVEKKFSGMVMNMGQSSNDWVVYSTMIAPGTFNFFGTMDPQITELAAKARALPADQSADLYRQMNERVVQQAWFLPFYRMTYKLVTVPGVTAVPQSGMAVPSIYNYSLTK